MQAQESIFRSGLSASDVLEAMKAPDGEDNSQYRNKLYVLGCLKSPLTFHSQQQRAFNLIWALQQTNALESGKELVVIGGGLAGVTAAAAALLCGTNVTLLERNSQVLQLQNKNTTRFIHPNLYDWPINFDNLKDETDLPCLNWTADYAGGVIEQVQRQWLEIEHEVNRPSGATPGPRLRVICNCEITSIQAREDAHNATRIHVRTDIDTDISEKRTPHEADYDCAILAVGFGIEASLGDKVPGNSYWMIDALEQVRPDRPRPNKVLVLGAGDGGLTDVLRLRIENFDHKTLHESLTAALHPSSFNLLSQIDEEVAGIIDDHERQQTLYDKYLKHLKYRGAVDVNKLHFRLRSDTYVVLRSTGKYPYDVTASILNRVAVFILMEILGDQSLRYVSQPISTEHVGRARWFEVQFGERKTEFHDIIVRLGTEKAVAKFFQATRVQRAFDPTRFAQYPSEFFSQKWKPLGRELAVSPDQSLPKLPSLIGREQDLARLLHVMENQQPRILTLTGPAGIGKSALAIVAAAKLKKLFGSVVYIDLRSIEFPQQFDSGIVGQDKLLAEKICEKLGLPSAPSPRIIDTITAALRYKKTLIVLDGFDRLSQSRQLLSVLLANAERLQFMVTSRSILGFAGTEELAFPLAELAHPSEDGAAPLTGDGVPTRSSAETPAVLLFLRCAELVGVSVAQESMTAVRQICHELDGVPLALKVVAVQLKHHPVVVLLEKVSALKSMAPANKALQLVNDELSESERAALNALSIFPSGCRWEQAKHICRTVVRESEDLAVIIQALVDAQLLERAEDFDGAPRFRMLQSVRSFAYEQLKSSGLQGELSSRFKEAYMLLAEEVEPKLSSGERDRGLWLERLRAEDENLRAALTQQNDNGDEHRLCLAGTLFWFWNFTSRLEEGLLWLNRILSEAGSYSNERALSKTYYARGGLEMLTGVVEGGRKDIADSLRLSGSILQQRPDDTKQRRIQALALIIRGMLYFEEDSAARKNEAINDFRRSGDIMRSIKDDWGEALATIDLARAEFKAIEWATEEDRTKKIEIARKRFESALAKWRAIGDRWGISLTCNEWGRFEAQINERLKFAQEQLQEALNIQRERHDLWGEANTLLRLAGALAQSDEPKIRKEAETHFREALKLNLDVGRREVMCECLIGLAELNLKQGDTKHARKAVCLFEAAATLLDSESPNVCKIEDRIKKELRSVSEVLSPDEIQQSRSDGAEIAHNKERWMELLG